MTLDKLKTQLNAAGILAPVERTTRTIRELLTTAGRAQRRQRERVTSFYTEFVHAEDLVFDVGAHIGIRVEVFLKLGARVVAVEPQAACQLRLYRHFGHNPRVSIVPRALDSLSGERVMRGQASSPMSSLSDEWIAAVQASGRFSPEEFSHREVVRTTTLDSLIAVFGLPHFCKVDVEGFEHNVLMGLTSPIPGLSLEFAPEGRSSTVKCLERLESIASYEFNFSAGEEMKLSMPRWLRRVEFLDALDQVVATGSSALFGDIYARLS